MVVIFIDFFLAFEGEVGSLIKLELTKLAVKFPNPPPKLGVFLGDNRVVN